MSDEKQRLFQIAQDIAAMRKILAAMLVELRVANGASRLSAENRSPQ